MTNRAVPDAGTQIEIYRRMALIKANDERSRKVIMTGRLVMPYYSPRGQEVIPSAISVNLTDEDYVCTIYRGSHDQLAKGLPLKDLWAEVAGRTTGTCKGKGGPMHVTYPTKGIMVTTGIVGSTMPIANGLAWASQLRGDGRVTVANFGDGAANIGAFHESLNLASVWKLPVIFVCQNNEWGEHTAYDKTSNVRVADRAAAYGIPGERVDGNDPFAMYAAAREAIERARAGEGPTLIEAMTYRFHGHVFGDQDAYMDKERKARAMADDPVPRFRARLIADGVASEEQLAEMEAGIEAQIDEAVEFALASDFPGVEELKRDVFAEELN
ncbi:thiamine pyrophosphate-dependent dehydrogenase E1 component subunit alpha [Sphingomonas histidinilytica]|uniref:Pyruvate dehydrogenase E1 component alpha subunit n=1 Tax=Rhizorhabdus histidinilytica TaxID=439228 RepID=A0A1T5A5K8_9SPHN|nr:thiamine pyrophosphate-dependent dehydrogenase E1 component subunit alpha [Rhizorhabdus histidinilytica]MBO9376216.1 thiamine pyrophosphate-dependent dehydrogenase E1 component subunit alpha [Rhizorhabdus histidinilytica]SKB30251.1 pyruvate dehydrogenase E1 component alpha subunit [Rhizorhabdus histidinilytica]